MYTLKKVSKLDIPKLNAVARILNACGKDMAQQYDLHHWDNPFIKTLIIVELCNIKNEIYLVYNETNPVATFMTKRNGDVLHFGKLGTFPSESRKGIGSFCVKKIEELAKKAGCKKVEMEVYELSQHAISFYEKKGYMTVGMTDTLKYKEIKMEKRL